MALLLLWVVSFCLHFLHITLDGIAERVVDLFLVEGKVEIGLSLLYQEISEVINPVIFKKLLSYFFLNDHLYFCILLVLAISQMI